MRSWPRVLGMSLVACLLSVSTVRSQPKPTDPSSPSAQTEAPKDALGRSTPRGAVLGFLGAARKGDYRLARQYLNTRLGDTAAEQRAEQLFVVLDAKLPARLTQVSDTPEGSRSNPQSPDEERIATLEGDGTPLDIVLERVELARLGPIWLFSARTLDGIPTVYEQVLESRATVALPRFLTDTRVRGVPVFEWLALLVGFPLFYLVIGLLNRLLTPLTRGISRRMFKQPGFLDRNALPPPARLLLLALTSRWILSTLSLSFRSRQFFSNLTALLTIVAIALLLMRLGEEIEAYMLRRFPPSNTAAVSLLRLARRGVDALVIFAALLLTLRHFGVDPTPALAGLGVGGIAVALAAQKTLENVIAGASLIFDKAVRVGDTLRLGTVVGTVDHIGLRSTWIRTLDRTMISIPNSQIANASVETLSVRDKFWFHPAVGLVYETTPSQLRVVLDGIRKMLGEHPRIDRQSVRVRFLNLGAFSLDVDVFAYVFARDWNHFLEIQEELLFGVTDIVAKAGTQIAFPSQTMYVGGAAAVPAAEVLPKR
jgi:MscS family membrane protein